MNGQVDKAIEMLKKFEKVNRKTVKPEIYEEFKKKVTIIVKEGNKQGNNYTVFDLFKLPRLGRITITLILYW